MLGSEIYRFNSFWRAFGFQTLVRKSNFELPSRPALDCCVKVRGSADPAAYWSIQSRDIVVCSLCGHSA